MSGLNDYLSPSEKEGTSLTFLQLSSIPKWLSQSEYFPETYK